MDHYKALAKAQAEMGPALKTATNPHFKKQYADLGAVQEACFDALRNNGFAVYQPIGRDEKGPFVKTIFAHEGGETLECTVPLMVGKGDMQGLGSAITYARRYGLMAMAGIAPEDDDGHGAAEGKRKEKQDEDARRAIAEREKREAQILKEAEREAKAESEAQRIIANIETCETSEELFAMWKNLGRWARERGDVVAAKDMRKASFSDDPAELMAGG